MDVYKETAYMLIDQYGISTRFINTLAEERNMENLLNVVERSLSAYDKLELMLRIEGSDFFAGSKQYTKELRRRIIDCWTDDIRNDEYRKRCKSSGKSDKYKSRKLAEMNWHRGSAWPKAFMEISGINPLFGGKKNVEVRYEDFVHKRDGSFCVLFAKKV